MYTEEIISIKPTTRQQTYDLEVPKYHNFILENEVITHNSAKSTLGMQICKYLDNDFSEDNIVFTQNDFFKAIEKSKPGTAILWDEFVMGGLSTEATSSNQNALIKHMTTIRKKKCFIVLVIPYFFMLRMYFAVARSRCLIHVYSPDGISRGKFLFFSYKRKKELYFKGRKYYSYGVATANFVGDFTNTSGWFIDMDAYEDKKDSAIKDIQTGKKKADGTPRTQHRMRQLQASNKRLVQELYNLTRAPTYVFLKNKYPWLPFGERAIATLMKLDPKALEIEASQSLTEYEQKNEDGNNTLN